MGREESEVEGEESLPSRRRREGLGGEFRGLTYGIHGHS